MNRQLKWMCVLFATAIAARAQDSTNAQAAKIIAQLNRTVTYRDVAISPDGTRAAWVLGRVGASGAALHLYERETNRDVEVSLSKSAAKDREDTGPAWSPDSKTVAFLSAGGKDGAPQLWTVNTGSTKAKKLADLTGYAAKPRWSSDGKQIAFLYVEGAHGGGPLMATGPQTGVIDEAFHNQRIAVVDADSGVVRQASPGDLNIYDFDWSRDTKQFAATAAPGPGDNNWWIAQLYTIDSASGKATSIYKPKLEIAVPRWSPDGTQIAFIEGIMSDEGAHGGDLYTIPASGGAPVDHMPGRKTSASSITWRKPEQILFSEYSGSGVNLSTLDLQSGTIEERWHGDEEARTAGTYPNLAIASDGITCAITRSSFAHPPEVWMGRIGEWQPVTHGNDGVTPMWGPAESLEWTSDGFQVHGWLLKPMRPAPGKSPLVVDVHGGPSSILLPGWPAYNGTAALLAASGYYVLLPNPRGSYGGGEAFTQANVKDFGHGDLRDIMTGVDAAIAKYPIDPDRLGITGWSYGGFMTMFAVTQTHRFAAAVAGAGLANWTSYYGENSIDQWMIPFFGASVYDDPAVYAKSSPIEYIKNVKTPTLVVVGEQDAECPAPQSFEFWHALKTLGVPTQLVVYPGEGHMFVKPADVQDEEARVLSWFDRYLRAK